MNEHFQALQEKKMKLYNAIQRGLMSKAFQYFVLFFIILAIGAVILSSYKESDSRRAIL